jgi:hypothetical protein
MVVRHANPEKNPVTVDDYNYKRRGGICFWQTFRFSTFNRRSSWTKVKTRIAFDRQNVFVGLKRVKRKCEMKEGRVALLFLLHPSISSLYWLHWKQALSQKRQLSKTMIKRCRKLKWTSRVDNVFNHLSILFVADDRETSDKSTSKNDEFRFCLKMSLKMSFKMFFLMMQLWKQSFGRDKKVWMSLATLILII